MEIARAQSEKVFEIQSYIYDKFFGKIRVGGVHLYRTKYLGKAMNYLEQTAKTHRPEATTLKFMETIGYPYLIVPEVVGLHDFEQDNFDIFRKSFVYAHKHINHAHEIVPYWRLSAHHDADYKIALSGFSEGIKFSGEIQIDWTSEEINMAWENYQVKNKPPLNLEHFNIEKIDKVLLKNINVDKKATKTNCRSLVIKR